MNMRIEELKNISELNHLVIYQQANNDMIADIATDSRLVKDKGLFFAIKGIKINGLDFITKAIENGAKTIIIEEQDLEYAQANNNLDNINIILCQNIINGLFLRQSYPKTKKF